MKLKSKSLPTGQCLMQNAYLIAATTWYSGFFQLSLVTRFACDIGQLARIWIWVSSEVITILSEYMDISRQAEYFIACYTVLTRPNKVETAVHRPVAILGFQFGLYYVVAPLSFVRSISLASLFAILSIFGWSDLCRSCVYGQHFRLRSFASACFTV